MTAYQARDGRHRVMDFDGEMLAEASSKRPGAGRWMELRLYRTVNGMYVIHKIGVSRMLHAPSCDVPTDHLGNRPTLPRFQAEYPGVDPSNGEFWYCDECFDDAQDNLPALEIEEDRHHTTWSEDPADIVESLYRKKDGARSMPKLSIDLLEDASDVDEGVRAAFQAGFVL